MLNYNEARLLYSTPCITPGPCVMDMPLRQHYPGRVCRTNPLATSWRVPGSGHGQQITRSWVRIRSFFDVQAGILP